jgi:hypothetical protein
LKSPFHHLARGIFIKDNKVLLAQASGNTNTFLPGVHIEFGKSAKDTMIYIYETCLAESKTLPYN